MDNNLDVGWLFSIESKWEVSVDKFLFSGCLPPLNWSNIANKICATGTFKLPNKFVYIEMPWSVYISQKKCFSKSKCDITNQENTNQMPAVQFDWPINYLEKIVVFLLYIFNSFILELYIRKIHFVKVCFLDVHSCDDAFLSFVLKGWIYELF